MPVCESAYCTIWLFVQNSEAKVLQQAITEVLVLLRSFPKETTIIKENYILERPVYYPYEEDTAGVFCI